MDGGLTGVSRSLPFTSSPYKVAPAPTSTSVSSMSMSHSTGGKGIGAATNTPTTVPKVGWSKHPLQSSSGGSGSGKGAASTTPATFPKVSGSKHLLQSSSGGSGSGGVSPDVRKKAKALLSPLNDAEEGGDGSGDEDDNEDEKEDDKDKDYVPVTDAAINNMMEGGDCGEMAAIIAMHRQAFMERAFPPEAEDDHTQKKAASIQTARPQEEFDYIEYVLKNWQHGVEVRNLLPGDC